jgi:hypothetical protein
MKTPAAKPPRPANQGTKAPANVQQPMDTPPAVYNTTNLPHTASSTDNAWANHMAAQQPGGTRGSGTGTR